MRWNQPVVLRAALACVLIGTMGVATRPVQSADAPASTLVLDPTDPIATITTSLGEIKLELFAKRAPDTVKNFIDLATGAKIYKDAAGQTEKIDHPFYDGLIFHRVIPGFMIQGGDPLGTGFGGPGYTIKDEIDPDMKFDAPGMLAMAHSAVKDSGGSQFFITTDPRPELNGGYAIFGQVLTGQSVVHEISIVARSGSEDQMDKPLRPVVMKSVTIETH